MTTVHHTNTVKTHVVTFHEDCSDERSEIARLEKALLQARLMGCSKVDEKLEQCQQQSRTLQKQLIDAVANTPKASKLSPAAQKVISEIVQTETTYVDGLSYVANVIIPTMIKNCDVDLQTSYVVFGSWDNLALCNSRFLRSLLLANHPQQNLNLTLQAFAELSGFYKFYADYFSAYKRSIDQVKKLQGKNTPLSKYLDKVNIQNYLILPVQRIPRYGLLLSALSKAVSAEEKKQVDLVLHQITELTSRLNRDAAVVPPPVPVKPKWSFF